MLSKNNFEICTQSVNILHNSSYNPGNVYVLEKSDVIDLSAKYFFTVQCSCKIIGLCGGKILLYKKNPGVSRGFNFVKYFISILFNGFCEAN